MAADLNGSMWLDSKFWGQLYDADKGSTARRVFFRFMQAATKLMGVLRGTTLDADRWVTNVEKVREAFVQAWPNATVGVHPRPWTSRDSIWASRKSVCSFRS